MAEAALPRHYRAAGEELLLPASPPARVNPFTPCAITTLIILHHPRRDVHQNANIHSSTLLYPAQVGTGSKHYPGDTGCLQKYTLDPTPVRCRASCTHIFTFGGHFEELIHLPACVQGVGKNQKTQRNPMGTPHRK